MWSEAHHDDASDLERVDAIVVLGAAQYDGMPSPVFEGRLDHAALLFEQGRAGLVFVLGANRPGDRTTEAEAGRDYLVAQGVPSTSVVAIPLGHTSYTSLRAAAAEMRARQLTSAFLVSDPWHNARIERMAGDLGIDGHASATWTSAARTEESARARLRARDLRLPLLPRRRALTGSGVASTAGLRSRRLRADDDRACSRSS